MRNIGRQISDYVQSFFPVPLQELPFDKEDDVIKATSFEVISTLRDVLKTSNLWRDHVQTYQQVHFLHPACTFSLPSLSLFDHVPFSALLLFYLSFGPFTCLEVDSNH